MFDSQLGDGSQRVDDPAVVADDELIARVIHLEAARVRLDAEVLAIVGELDARGTCDTEAGNPTVAWLAHEARLPVAVARARVVAARKLRSLLPEVAGAWVAGRIGWDHVRVLVELANPRIAGVVAENQELLIGLADRCRFEQWRAEVRALGRLWDQDGGYDPNDDPASNRLSFGTTIDGLTSLAATLTGASGEVVTQAIDAMADELFRAAVADRDAAPELEVPCRAQLRADALVELIRRALAVDLDATAGPIVEATLVVNAEDPTDVSDPDGVPLADGTTRVLRCDALFAAVVVNRLGVPVDLGRAARLASEAQRRGAKRRDGGCVFTGCTARVAWCDVHHCIHWANQGVTDLCNLICLCRRHHGVAHRNGWDVRLDPDGWAAFKTPSGRTFWGQRHGRQRAGPPPDPALFDTPDDTTSTTGTTGGAQRTATTTRLADAGPGADRRAGTTNPDAA